MKNGTARKIVEDEAKRQQSNERLTRLCGQLQQAGTEEDKEKLRAAIKHEFYHYTPKS